jgi:UDPglucose 6-dehydrogenase
MINLKPMEFKSINICGYGYVGEAFGSLCEKNQIKFNVYDVIKKEGNFNYFSKLYELVENSEKENNLNYYIISVPTPSNDDGTCNTNIVETIIRELKYLVTKREQKSQSVVIIKSTIVPGTTTRLNTYYKTDLLDIIFCPEFLTEKNYKTDMYNAEFVILGLIKDKSLLFSQQLMVLFRRLYIHKSIEIYIRSSEEAELFKYTVNSYLALKVGYFNEINEICEKMDINYNSFKGLFQLEPRIGNYGITVPGSHGYGYSGTCLPKDSKSMSKFQQYLNIDNSLLKSLTYRNESYFRLKEEKND